MNRIFAFFFFITALSLAGCGNRGHELLLDSFEGEISESTVDFGASEGSSVTVQGSTAQSACGGQSLKIEYDLLPSGYMWIARGFDLDVEGAGWSVSPEQIPWRRFNAVSLMMLGEGAGGVVAFDIKDAGGEVWRFLLDDDEKGWRQIECPFRLFFPRKDWQPESAQKNDVLDFPIKSYQFEPRLPGKGVYYFDCVTLARIEK